MSHREYQPPKDRPCIKCRERFEPPATRPWTKQCAKCAPVKLIVGAALPPAGHTHEWDKRSLGLVEASILRRAWGRPTGNNVTGD